jgi:uncharacterized cupin superfamily protein
MRATISAVRRVNLFSPDFDHTSEREGYRWRGARIGTQLGAERIGGSVYELGDGERTFPYHVHHGMEEWLFVVAGSPVLRTPAGERSLRPGDVVCFPAGPDGAHQVGGPGTVLILSANRVPETVEYLDSGKVGAVPPRKVFRAADAVDYWDGE